MVPHRFVFSDRRWRAIKPLCPGSIFCSVRTGIDTGCSLKRCFELFGRMPSGANFLQCVALGTAPSDVSAGGLKLMCSNGHTMR